MTTILKKIGIALLILLVLAGLGYWLGKDAFFQYMGKKFFKDIEDKALAEAFRGVETSTGKEIGMFPIQSTGVSTAPIKQAAEALLNSLGDEMREEIQFEIDDIEWRMWSNVDNGIYERQGVSLKDMDADQKSAAFKLMQESLSAKGLQLSKDIMKTDQTLRELNNNEDFFDEELYFFTFMGTPSETEPWGWQLDGHHLIINYFILGDQVVMTPTFMGGEPIITTTGKYKGNTLFQDEQNIGLAFMQSLPPELQKEATISPEKTRNNNQGEFAKDNITLDYEGLKASKLSDEHKSALLNLAFQYISNMRAGHNRVKMEEIEAHWDQTWFAWVGATDEEAVFYYRIHSPVVLIEFDHQRAVGAPTDKKGPTRNHIHTVVRTPNGNDYGKDLLRQHLEDHHH
ncbi:MAG: DUF3500 domain-containing protein [Bacteroidia bacterium]|nr:DUF3500 domain-containing protein [Bacteroidia bacterium]